MSHRREQKERLRRERQERERAARSKRRLGYLAGGALVSAAVAVLVLVVASGHLHAEGDEDQGEDVEAHGGSGPSRLLFSVGDVPAAQRKRHRLCGNERAHATEQQHEKEANRLHAAYYDPP